MPTISGLHIQKNVQLSDFSTMGVRAKAKVFIELHDVKNIPEIINYIAQGTQDFLILGGGSNILFSDDFDGVVIQNKIMGIEIVQETESEVTLKIGAGENWHSLVEFCVSKNWYGIENLALIPGTVGAAPIQNIGAYGVELEDVFVELEAFLFESQTLNVYKKKACEFGYRDSVFKHSLKNKVMITSVSLTLQKQGKISAEYGALKSHLQQQNIQEPTIHDIFEAVMEVRRSKLPDPSEIGNNGSFFKNPIVPIVQFNALKNTHPQMPSYPVNEQLVKVPAGWLIDTAGWKGYRKGDAGIHAKQALVLVNYGNATGKELYKLSEMVQKDVREKFGITLEREVNIIPTIRS